VWLLRWSLIGNSEGTVRQTVWPRAGTRIWPRCVAASALAVVAVSGMWVAAAATAVAHSQPHRTNSQHHQLHQTRQPHETVVSLTFDDGDADQLGAARLLHAYGERGTFYVISGAVGAPGYLSLANLREIHAAGDEIGAHTVSHLDLTKISAAEARRQACVARAVVTRWGFAVTSFAYPDAAFNPAAEAIVRACGYGSARIGAGLRSGACPRCARAETVPPANPYAVRTPSQVDTSWTLRDLENVVTTAERGGGGWVPLIFHHVCRGRCGDLSVSTGTFSAFVRWLAQRHRFGTVVRTVSQVTGGGARPIVAARPAKPHRVINGSLESAGTSGAVNPALEAASGGDVPVCWMRGGYGRNAPRFQRTRDAHNGRWAERLTITSYTSGDAKLLQQFDLGSCALPVQPGRSYVLSSWYKSTARTQFTAYYRT
jgi:peptidoglycan/xylan/chitin deacetylase (PgdA/CDA1 family)